MVQLFLEGCVALFDNPQSQRSVKVWHVKEDPQRQIDVKETLPAAGL